MSLELDPLEQRIVGALVEKELQVPESYPLTVNALTAAVNQRSNREPPVTHQDFEVEGALRALMERGWVLQHEREGGRTRRFAHEMRRQLGVEDADCALLAELLNRGPQTPAELKVRASRMRPFANPEEVEARLAALAARPVPFVRRLARRPREHAARWAHRLGRGSEEAAAAEPATPPDSAPAPEGPSLASRVEALEREVEALRDRLDRLGG